MTYLAIEQALNDRWPMVELRRVARIRRETNSRSEETLLALSAYTGVRPRPEDGGNQLPSEETITGYWVARPGDLVFNPMWALEGGVAVSEYRGALSTAYRVYDLGPAIAPRFAHYYFRSRPAIEQYRLMVRGLTTFDRSVSREDFEGMPMPLPPFDVQQTIADYLDTETARIDALVSKKQRMIELLGQRLNSAIEEELLNGNPRIIPLRRLLLALPQYGAGETGGSGEDDWPRYIRITDLNSEGKLKMDQVLRLPPEVAAPYRLHHGDVLIARSGGTVGKAFRYTSSLGAACFAGYLIRFRFDSTMVDSRIVEAWTKTQHYWSQVYGSALQATIQNVSAQQYLSLLVPVPSLEDQRRLVDDFTRMGTEITRLIEINERQISLFQERRQALITAAVTGQLDIPEVAA